MEKLNAYYRDSLLCQTTRGHCIGGEYYFPPESTKYLYIEGWALVPDEESNVAGEYYEGDWRGRANYLALKTDKALIRKAAWTYRDPEEFADSGEDRGGKVVIRIVWQYICFNPDVVRSICVGRLNMFDGQLDEVGLNYMSETVRREYIEQKLKYEEIESAKKEGIVLLFPGQGAQQVGMAADLVERSETAKELFDNAEDILGYDLLEICRDGPEEKLGSTVYAQPAIFVTCMAAIQVWEEENPTLAGKVVASAGLSLGEYTSLCYAGVLSFEECLGLVKIRAESMQECADHNESGMISLLGLNDHQVDSAIARTAGETSGLCVIANKLCPGNNAISCDSKSMDVLERVAKEIKEDCKVIRLKVAGAFHSRFMSTAKGKLEEAMAEIEFQAPRYPVYSNVEAQPHSPSPVSMRKLLARQMVEPVLWNDIIVNMLSSNYANLYEVGVEAGMKKVLTGLNQRIVKQRFDSANISLETL